LDPGSNFSLLSEQEQKNKKTDNVTSLNDIQ
jgi:hypothetical protein